jgi:hypothetical protein
MSSAMIEEYHFGHIVVDGRAYNRDVIIHPGGVDPNWWRAQSHHLSPGDLSRILFWNPQVLVVGTGASGMMVIPDESREMIRQRKIHLVVERTEEACQVYNRQRSTRRAVAALHLTC